MAYKGSNVVIDCGFGGLTGNNNIESIKASMMVYPTRNLNLQNGGRQKRGGSALVNVAAFSGAPHVVGVYDFLMESGTQYIITATNDGKIRKDATTTIGTGMSTSSYYSFETGDNKLFIADGVTMPQVWDGTSGISEIDHPATDWATKKPFQFIKYGRFNSERMWAICKNGIYGSTKEDFEDFTDSTVIYIPIDTSDGFGLQGAAILLSGRLCLFGKNKAYILEDADTDTDLWGYMKAPWDGGVANFRLIIRTATDVVCMTEEGEIYSVSAAETEGEDEKASLTRPALINTWIQDRVNLAFIADFHGVYDPVLRAIKIFVVRTGQLTIDTALVNFGDIGSENGWMVHDNQQYVSGYSATSSALIRKGVGNYKIYTGDYIGQVWELETTARNDNNNGFDGKFTTPILNLGDSTVAKHFNELRVIGVTQGNYNLTVDWWVDGVAQTSGTISLNSSLTFIDQVMGLGRVGRRVQFSIYNATANQDFFIHSIIIYFKSMGKVNE